MENLNDPKLTNQERQQILKLAIDKDYAEEYKENGEEQGCFHSQWIISPSELRTLNLAAQKTDCWFDFYDEPLSQIVPFASQILLEGERVEEGEWDKTYERWCPYSYQRVLVVNTNSVCVNVSSKGFEVGVYAPDEEHKEEWIKEYPKSITELGTIKPMCILGVIDIPLELLNQFDDKRTQKRIWTDMKTYLSQEVEKRKQSELEHNAKEERRKDYGKSKIKKKSIKKLKKGFAQ